MPSIATALAPGPTVPVAPRPVAVPEWIWREMGSVALPFAQNSIALDDSPNVLITRENVLLDGQRVATVQQITNAGTVTRVEGLFGKLDAMRKALQKAHGGTPFPGSLNYWIDPHVPALVVKSVLETAASAGYPYGAFVVRQRGALDVIGRVLVDAAPPLPTADIAATSGLPPEVIQRVARQNYSIFQRCYAQGVARTPALQGRVAVWLVIGLDGRVAQALDGGSTLPDAEVVRCVVEGFRGLVFPAPSERVTVVYPFLFEPGMQ
jgi:hypothetical protein